MTYESFFAAVTGNDRGPFPYQTRLGTEPWPDLIDVPTGLGKTAAVIVAWLYKRVQADPTAATRLIYCLPMRVLVQQTEAAARGWCANAAPYFEARELERPTVHVLMGGDADHDWEDRPESPAILIGTQDMLLSRALNRGFALSRYKWPVHFSLLNNDCLWAFDETQLIGVGIETSAQLQGLRAKLGTCRPTHSLWMSATLGARQLDTVDHPRPEQDWASVTLRADDLEQPVVQARVAASKPIGQLPDARLDKESEKQGYVESLASVVLEQHAKRRGLTLVIVNRVSRAQAIYQKLLAAEGQTENNTALVHSRFRAPDRGREEDILQDTTRDRIVVATQAVEAGVDVSARTLFTELAPWPSLVQRFGRCNRYGGEVAAIHWLDVDTSDEKSTLSLPYERSDLDRARELLAQLEARGGDAGPQSLKEIVYDPPFVIRPVIRRRDLLDLFDTTSELLGSDVDVSRYVRDGEDTDVQFYWRRFEASPSPDDAVPARDELCRVPVNAARDFLTRLTKERQKLASRSERDRERAKNLHAWRWSPLHGEWESVTSVYPGQIVLLHTDAGGYSSRLGWIGEVELPSPIEPWEGNERPVSHGDSLSDDSTSGFVGGRWVRLSDHLGHVRDEAALLAVSTGLSNWQKPLAVAGLWHDVGKAHAVFQRRLLEPTERKPELKPSGEGPWAKSNHRLKAQAVERKYFRHELASALAWLSAGDATDSRLRDLVAYLIAAHHGKVRLSLRAVPGEVQPEEPGRLFARGVWDRDVLPAFELPDGRRFESVELDLSVMRLGQGSWLERMLALRDAEDLGPFRLAMLETIVRIADWRASHKEQEGPYDA